jgi:SPP1 family predicted phage head-tail adaptor
MIRHRLNTTLTVFRPAAADDGAGGQTVTFGEAGEVRAQVSQPTAEERATAQQFGANLTHLVHTTYGADVRRGDELDGDLPSATGERLRVFAVVSDSRSTYKRLECEAVQAGG